ncbi:globin domain-containing protein [Sphingorhabdus sp. Alg231-15]|uniref:globin domain-containing protein n=1 Tax=Sphingorhabdus sp. Alg231-15 TaxID=1922222 RepID=UPI000D55BCBB
MDHLSKFENFLTVAEIDIVRRSFLNLGDENARAGELFYQQLFDDKPELKSLFLSDISVQSEKLTNMLGMIVSQIHNMPELLPMLADLARRHLGYGVEAEHYRDVGDALISTIRDVLGPKFGPDVEAAWTKAYEGIALTMIQCCYGRAGIEKYEMARTHD